MKDFEFNELGTCKHLVCAELYRTKVQLPRCEELRAEAERRRGPRRAAASVASALERLDV